MRSAVQRRTAPVLDRALEPGVLYAAYQPIVEISSGATVAVEALARWHDPELNPGVVFPAFAAADRLHELDWACRVAALQGALDAGLHASQTLFVNVEPAIFGNGVPPEAVAVIERAAHDLRVVVELTERSLLRNPSAVLRMVDWARSHGWGVALDDVGADPDSLTLLPFVLPDVIKLDISLVQERQGIEQGRIMAAVSAHAEANGTAILAEGIETSAHLDQALALGATLGQGWLFARPGPLDGVPPCSAPVRLTTPPPAAPTPFSLVDDSPRKRIGYKETLLGMSHHIESLASKDSDFVLLSAFQSAERFTPGTAMRYERLARFCALVGALGVGMHDEPVSGVRGANLDRDDDLADEWTVICVGPHYAGALIAKDCGDDGPDDDRRFEFVVTHDRALVLAAARSLMSRLLPLA